MKTSKLSVFFAIVMLMMMVVPAHAKKLCFQLFPSALGAGAPIYTLTEIPTGNGNFLLSGKSTTELPFPPFPVTEAIVTGGGGVIDEMIEISLDEKSFDSSDFLVDKQVHLILDPESNEGTYESVFTTYPTGGNPSTSTQSGTVDHFKCNTLNQ